jgi:hypothetical protein
MFCSKCGKEIPDDNDGNFFLCRSKIKIIITKDTVTDTSLDIEIPYSL